MRHWILILATLILSSSALRAQSLKFVGCEDPAGEKSIIKTVLFKQSAYKQAVPTDTDSVILGKNLKLGEFLAIQIADELFTEQQLQRRMYKIDGSEDW